MVKKLKDFTTDELEAICDSCRDKGFNEYGYCNCPLCTEDVCNWIAYDYEETIETHCLKAAIRDDALWEGIDDGFLDTEIDTGELL